LCLRSRGVVGAARHDGAVQPPPQGLPTMKPVLILQFMANDAPAYLGTWLQLRGITCDVRLATTDVGFPERIDGYSALALLGGSMSANDDLPFLRTAESLIDQAMRNGVPVLGHCLGGQLMARSLGARVAVSPAPEVGWHRMQRIDTALSGAWLGQEMTHDVFHWHYEAFDLPTGSQRLAASEHCPNQAFAVGPHLGLQFHVEVDAAKVELWLTHHDAQYEQSQLEFDTIHRPARIRADTVRYLGEQQRLADRIYGRWAETAGLIPQ
jgi:GMP synthase-like glutamine amidotransferase